VRVILVVGPSPLAKRLFDRVQGDSVDVIGCVETIDEAVSMVDSYKLDVVLVATAAVPAWKMQAGFQLDVLEASVTLASLPPAGPAVAEPDSA
jgi:hypothetical protein